MTSLPLEGVKIVELATWFTAPSAACLLADQGADVIKVEAPEGDVYRKSGTSRAGMSTQWMAANRNKRFVSLDLKQEADRATMIDLVAKADVFIHNVRPGAIKRLGFDAETLRAKFPKLIHASVYAYGKDGPYADAPGFDTLFQALSGMCYIQADHHTGKPQVVRSFYIDKATGCLAAEGVVAALFKRERTGEGSTVEYSMMDGTVWFTWPDGMTEYTLIDDDRPRGQSMADIDQIAQTADGFLITLPHMQPHWEAFCKLTGREDLLTKEGFATPFERMSNLKVYFATVSECMAGKTTQEWCDLFNQAGIPVAPVLRPDQLKDFPQVRWNGSLTEVNDEVLGRYRSPVSPLRFDGQAFATRRSPRAPGTDTEEVLRDWGVVRQNC